MNAVLSRAIGTGAFFLFLLLSGFWLTRSGRPYNVILFNVHKFIALGLIIYLAISITRVNQAAPLVPFAFIAIAITGVFIVTLLVTGGLLNIPRPMPPAVRTVHHLLPYLAALSTAALLYLLPGR